MKRVHETNDGDDHEHPKRSRRSRWDHDRETTCAATNETVAAGPQALSDIVKRLSSVVQEKSAPEELQTLTKGAVSRPLIVSTQCL